MREQFRRLNAEGVRLLDIVMISMVFFLTLICLSLYAIIPDPVKAENFWQMGLCFGSMLLGKFTNSFGKPLIPMGGKNGSTDKN